MRIAIFGLGYVGSVSAGCLAAAGHEVVGVDVEPQKLELLRQGRSPVTEPGLDDLLAAAIEAGRLRVTGDTAAAVRASDLSLVCVGTPSRRNGSLDSTYLERVIQQIGEALAGGTSYHVVAVRGTLLPGLLESTLVPLLEKASGRRVGVDVGVCVNPEFLREGSAIRDFQNPPFTVIGETDPRADVALGQLVGRNLAYIQQRLHLAQLMDEDWQKLVREADVVIVGKQFGGAGQLALTLRSDQFVIDLVGIDTLSSAVRPWAAPLSGASADHEVSLDIA